MVSYGGYKLFWLRKKRSGCRVGDMHTSAVHSRGQNLLVQVPHESNLHSHICSCLCDFFFMFMWSLGSKWTNKPKFFERVFELLLGLFFWVIAVEIFWGGVGLGLFLMRFKCVLVPDKGFNQDCVCVDGYELQVGKFALPDCNSRGKETSAKCQSRGADSAITFWC